MPAPAALRTLLAAALALLATGGAAHAACNLIPPARSTFPSTLGGIKSPIALANDQVELRLAACDPSPGFDPVAANNIVEIVFVPGGPNQPAPTVVPGDTITLANCAGTCRTLRFPMPPTPDRAGPAQITVEVNGQTVAEIGPLFQVQLDGATCDKIAETVFKQFTVLPPANDFGDLVSGAATEMRATLDGSGSILIPFDYRQVLPLGPGMPVARLIAGTSSIDAFSANPGQPIVVPAGYVRSFTTDGRPLPPLLRVTDLGDQLFGATDGAVAIVRIARDGDAGVQFDLSDRRTNNGYGPIVVPHSQYTVQSDAAIPLQNLQSTAQGVAYARDESIEGDLNGDGDSGDQVPQLVEVGTFISTNTGMAASPVRNPLVGSAGISASTDLAAFLQSEQGQRADLNGDGDRFDDLLRVFDYAGVERTPPASFPGRAFPAVNRRSVAIDGDLVYFREPVPGLVWSSTTSEIPGPDGTGVIAMPDGKVVYAAVRGGGFTSPFSFFRNPESGEVISAGDQAPAYQNATGFAATPEGRTVYVARAQDDAIDVGSTDYFFDSHVLLGAEATVVDGGDDGFGNIVSGILGVTRVAVSPDGRFLYASGTAGNSIAVFERTISGGFEYLTFVESHFDGVDGVNDMNEPRGIAVSPDGRHVYVAAHGSHAVTFFARDTNTGSLAYVGSEYSPAPREVVVSPDGLNVYVTEDSTSSLDVFERSSFDGLLFFAEEHLGLTGAGPLAITSDGQQLYVGGTGGPTPTVFTRTMPFGLLSFVEVEPDPFPALGSGSVGGLSMSPDDEHLYVLANRNVGNRAAIDVYGRKADLRAFDVASGTLRPGLSGALTTVAAAAGGRAVFVRAEGGAGGVDLDGDGTTTDKLLYVYDGATDTATQVGGATGIVPRLVAMSPQLVAFTERENEQTPPVDLNGDGTMSDVSALSVIPTATLGAPATHVPLLVDDFGGFGNRIPPGFAVTDLCDGGSNANGPCRSNADCPSSACRGNVVMAVPEFTYASNADLNGDGDKLDDELVIYRSGSKKIIHTGQAVRDFVVLGNLVAFRTFEDDQGQEDLNHNGGDADAVLQIYDFQTDTVIPTGQAVLRCDLPGCAPGQAYRVICDPPAVFPGRCHAVAFLTAEFDQQAGDLDGNGSDLDVVVQTFDLRSLKSYYTGVPAGAPTLPPLPESFAGAPIMYQEVKESDLNKDLNEDGDLDDVVTLVDGDTDGDGVFDHGDSCPQISNPTQRDTDGDGIRDACDASPFCATLLPPSPPTPPVAAAKCQKALGKAVRTLLLARTNASRGCLDDLAAGKLVGQAGVTCIGGLPRVAGEGGPLVVPPAEAKTAARIGKATAKLTSALLKSCSDADLATLQACSSTRDGIVACAAGEVAAASALMLDLAYGDVQPIADPLVLKCQKKVGAVALKNLASAAGAMTSCLDKLAAGKLVGDPQEVCFGASTPGGLTLPTDKSAAKAIVKLGTSEKSLAASCPGAAAASLSSCGVDAPTLAGCLACPAWREALRSVTAGYGPN